MKTYLINTEVFNKIYTKYLAGFVFHQTNGTETIIKMVTLNHEKMLLDFFENNKIEIKSL